MPRCKYCGGKVTVFPRVFNHKKDCPISNMKITGPGIVTILDKKAYVRGALSKMYLEQKCPSCGGVYEPAYGDFIHYHGCTLNDKNPPAPPKPLAFPDYPVVPKNPTMMGWMCPRCGRGNAPHVNTCSCKPLEVTC